MEAAAESVSQFVSVAVNRFNRDIITTRAGNTRLRISVSAMAAETAQQGLCKLETAGVVELKTEGRQFVFEAVR